MYRKVKQNAWDQMVKYVIEQTDHFKLPFKKTY